MSKFIRAQICVSLLELLLFRLGLKRPTGIIFLILVFSGFENVKAMEKGTRVVTSLAITIFHLSWNGISLNVTTWLKLFTKYTVQWISTYSQNSLRRYDAVLPGSLMSLFSNYSRHQKECVYHTHSK